MQWPMWVSSENHHGSSEHLKLPWTQKQEDSGPLLSPWKPPNMLNGPDFSQTEMHSGITSDRVKIKVLIEWTGDPALLILPQTCSSEDHTPRTKVPVDCALSFPSSVTYVLKQTPECPTTLDSSPGGLKVMAKEPQTRP